MIEAREERDIAPYAMKSSKSRGRVHAEDEDPYRTRYQRDRDRIIHSTAFRRLEYKTQVFVTHEGDYYRTRLTHTLEVAQLARSIARALGANEDLVEAVALAHDLGHTPFGHSGEDALNTLMSKHGGFEHNTHGLRVVTLLEKQYPDFPGLNLTYEVRESIVKHRTDYDNPYHPDYEPEKSPLVESQIVDMADAIAYANHDLDDGLKAGIIELGELEGVPLWAEAAAEVEKSGKRMNERIRARQIVKTLIRTAVGDLIENSEKKLKSKCVDSPEKAQAERGYVISFSTAYSKKRGVAQKFLHEQLYRHYRVVRMQQKAMRFIIELFNAYAEHPDQLPPDHQEQVKSMGAHRAVADYIAGMTDRYALDEYQKLFHPWERV
jgi:dGTPase